MKLTIDSTALAEALAWTVKAIAAKPPNPVLAGVLLTATEGVLRLAAFNYEVSHRTSLAADIDVDGTVLVHGQRLAQLVKALRKGNTVLEVRDNTLLVQSGRSLFTLGMMRAEEYPAFPALPPKVGAVDGVEFSRAIEQTAVSASRDDSVPVLASLSMAAEAGVLTIYSTDRYRLAEKSLPWDGDDTVFLARATDLAGVAGAAGQVVVHADDAMLGFTVGPRTTTVAQQGGDYPKIRSLFPDSHEVEVVIDRAEALEAVQRAAIVAERNTPIRCEITTDGFLLDAGTGEEAQSNEYLPCTLDGDSITAAFNPGFLIDALKSVDGPAARIRFTHPAKPALIMGGEADDYRHLVMPVRLPA